MILSLIEATGRALTAKNTKEFGVVWVSVCPFCPEGGMLIAIAAKDFWHCRTCFMFGGVREFFEEWGRLQYMKGYFAGDSMSRWERKKLKGFEELTKQQNGTIHDGKA